MRVPHLIQSNSVGANDALILICLEELTQNLLQALRPLYFVSADKDLATAAITGLSVETLPR